MINNKNIQEIYLAGGCFWGIQAFVDRLPGVVNTSVGYANGKSENPSYDEVCTDLTGHAETVMVMYDTNIISLNTILTCFFTAINPTTLNYQGPDHGTQYRSGIFYKNPADKKIIETIITQQQKKHVAPIVTEILPLNCYYTAEEYHQKYLEKNPQGYCHIDLAILDKLSAGKFQLADNSYHKPSSNEIKNKLTKDQYYVTQSCGTEPPFHNEYWDNKQKGIYVDIVTGEPLFASTNKFDSGSGWPSFTKPINTDAITTAVDNSLSMERVEVKSRYGQSHLGHVFPDGPKEYGGMRYCINSASLKFIPLDEMAASGYSQYIDMIK